MTAEFSILLADYRRDLAAQPERRLLYAGWRGHPPLTDIEVNSTLVALWKSDPALAEMLAAQYAETRSSK